mgnify:CR=1 FL=1
MSAAGWRLLSSRARQQRTIHDALGDGVIGERVRQVEGLRWTEQRGEPAERRLVHLQHAALQRLDIGGQGSDAPREIAVADEFHPLAVHAGPDLLGLGGERLRVGRRRDEDRRMSIERKRLGQTAFGGKIASYLPNLRSNAHVSICVFGQYFCR